MDPLDPVRERHERGEIFPVYLVITRVRMWSISAPVSCGTSVPACGFGKVFQISGALSLARVSPPVLPWAAANWYL